MTDKALANAMAKHDAISLEIASLGKRIAELKEELARAGGFIEAWHEFAAATPISFAAKPEREPNPHVTESLSQGVDNSEVPKKRRAAGNPKKEDVVEAARQIIKERGEPVSRSDLFKALAERGIIISSETDPEMVLSTMLWRMRDHIARIKGGGYWLAELPYEPAGYDPFDQIDDTIEADAERQVQVDVFK